MLPLWGETEIFSNLNDFHKESSKLIFWLPQSYFGKGEDTCDKREYLSSGCAKFSTGTLFGENSDRNFYNLFNECYLL